MLRSPIFLAIALLLPSQAQAAFLRPYMEITGGMVRLSDLFGQLGSTPDRLLGKGPMPGERITVGSAQLAAIARDFGVDWRPETGNEMAVIERAGTVLPQAAIANAVRQALLEKGAPALSDIAMPEAQPIEVPQNSLFQLVVSLCSYAPDSGRFTALISVSAPDLPVMQQRVSGTVTPLAWAAVATRRLSHGTLIGSGDAQTVEIKVQRLHGNAAIDAQSALGMSVKHDIAPGQPLTAADLSRPYLVARGAMVAMRLVANGITLSAEGIAREPGAKGDRIRVENPASHTVIEAEITGENAVRVEPAGATIALAAAQ